MSELRALRVRAAAEAPYMLRGGDRRLHGDRIRWQRGRRRRRRGGVRRPDPCHTLTKRQFSGRSVVMPRTTKPTDHTLLVLKQIRDAVSQTNERLDQTREELSAHIDQLARRQTETEIRLATALTDVVGAIHEVRDAVRSDRDLRKTVADHEQRLAAIERRTG